MVEAAGLGALAQVKANATSVGAKAAVGVSAITKLCACPAGMLAGVLAVPVRALVVGSVVWNTKPAGMPVVGAIVQVEASAGPALMIVANAVAVLPTATERLVGSTAATSVSLTALFAVKLAVTVVLAPSVTVQVWSPLQPPPDHPAKVEPE